MSLRIPYLGVCLLAASFFTSAGTSLALTPTPSPTPSPTPTATATPNLPPIEILLPPSSVTATTADGSNVAANVVDNNLGTRWSGFGNGATLQFNMFGLPRMVSHVKVAVHQGDRRRNRFDLQITSNNGVSWTTVFSGQSSGTTTAEETYDLVPDRLANGVRYVGRGSTAGDWNSVTEVSLFTPDTRPTCSVTPSATRVSPGETVVFTASCRNLGLISFRPTLSSEIFAPRPEPIQVSSGPVSWTLTAVRTGDAALGIVANGETNDPVCGCFHFVNVSASSRTVSVVSSDTPVDITPPAARVSASGADGMNVAANVVDGNLATRWSAQGDGQWLEMDLGAVRSLAYVTLAVHRGHERRNHFELQVAGENRQWTTVWSGDSILSALEETYDVPDQPARYVRYVGHGSSDPMKPDWNSVVEISLFGR
jgi:hypothetical protein